MKNIFELLDKYKNIVPNDRFVSDAFLEILNEFGIKIEKKDFKINDGVIRLKSNSKIRNRVFLNKEKILQKLKERLGKKSPGDII